MAAESEQPTPPEQPSARAGEQREERYGPLALLRMSKADGRALLLFSHREQEREQ
jgi:hypothetical protein